MQNYRFYKMQQPNFEKIHMNVVSFLCHTLLDQHLVYIPLANKQMKLIKEKIQAWLIHLWWNENWSIYLSIYLSICLSIYLSIRFARFLKKFFRKFVSKLKYWKCLSLFKRTFALSFGFKTKPPKKSVVPCWWKEQSFIFSLFDGPPISSSVPLNAWEWNTSNVFDCVNIWQSSEVVKFLFR